jgi:hypothetical protein
MLAPLIAKLEKAHEARVDALLRRASENKKKAIVAVRESSAARAAATRSQLQAKLKSQRRQTTLLKKELAKAQRFEFGSYTPGIEAWREKWSGAKGRRVLYLAPKDYAGSLMKWAWAVHGFSEYAVRAVVYQPHQFGYQWDLLFPDQRLGGGDIGTLLGEADVVHIKDERSIFEGQESQVADIVATTTKPVVFTHYGGIARKYKNDPAYRAFVGGFAARVAMTPDLCYDWFSGHYIPQAIDTEHFQYSWSNGNKLGHSPSRPTRKATAELIAAAGGLDLTLEVITGVPHAECLARKRSCSLFFDQAGREDPLLAGVDDVIGWYANASLEAAVHGIPTIAHLSDDSFARASAAGCDIRDACAIINTPMGVEGIRATLQDYLKRSAAEKTELSLRTRRWIEDFHSYQVVGKRLADLYRSLH